MVAIVFFVNCQIYKIQYFWTCKTRNHIQTNKVAFLIARTVLHIFLRIEQGGKEGNGVESIQRINLVILVNDPPLSQPILSQELGSAKIEKLFQAS